MNKYLRKLKSINIKDVPPEMRPLHRYLLKLWSGKTPTHIKKEK